MYEISEELASIIRNGLTTTNSRIEVNESILDDNDIYSFEIADDIGIEGEPSIGSAVAKGMTLEIVPESASMVLTGNAIKVSLGYNLDESEEDITEESEVEYIPFGVFYADPGSVQYGEDRITVECYDKMYFWDNVHYATTLAYPASTHDMLREISDLTGVEIEGINQVTETTWLSRPAKSIRQMLSAIAELDGKQAIINRNGRIAFIQNSAPIDPNGLCEFTADDYNQGGFTVTDECSITKLINLLPVEEEEETEEEIEDDELIEDETEEEDEKDNSIEYGTDEGKSLTIENENIRTLGRLQYIYNKCFPLSWRGFELSLCYGAPWIDAGDIITVTDINGNTYSVPVMSHTFRYDGGTSSEMSTSVSEEDNAVSYSEDYSQKIVNTERTVGKIKNQILGVTSDVKSVRTKITTVEQSVDGIRQTVEDNYEELYQAIDNTGTYSIKIESDTTFSVKANKSYNLSCFVYRIYNNITNQMSDNQFRWYRQSSDPIADLKWNMQGHIGSHLTINFEDINEDGCVFYCEVAIYEEENSYLCDREGKRLCYRDGDPIVIKNPLCVLTTGVPMQRSSDNYKALFEMLKDRVLLSLDHNGKLAQIDLQNGKDSIIQLLADMIKLEGLVTANEYFKILLDGSVETRKITIIDEDGAAVVTSKGLKQCFVYESSGDVNGFQQIGWCDNGGTVVSFSAIMSVFVPAGITVTKATLKTIIISRHLTNSIGPPGPATGIYGPKQIKMSYNVNNQPNAVYTYPYYGTPTLGIASGTDISAYGTWTPTPSITPQTKDVDVTSLIQTGKFITFNAYSAKSYANNDEWCSGGICKMVLIVEGYKKG